MTPVGVYPFSEMRIRFLIKYPLALLNLYPGWLFGQNVAIVFMVLRDRKGTAPLGIGGWWEGIYEALLNYYYLSITTVLALRAAAYQTDF